MDRGQYRNLFMNLNSHELYINYRYCECNVKGYKLLSTSGSCQSCVFSWEGHILRHEVFIRNVSNLALEVYNTLFIDSLGFMVVD